MVLTVNLTVEFFLGVLPLNFTVRRASGMRETASAVTRTHTAHAHAVFPAAMLDAIIVERYIEIASRLRRVLAVVKVRGSAHSDELREFMITDEGIIIGKPVRDYEGLLSGRPMQTPEGDAADRAVKR